MSPAMSVNFDINDRADFNDKRSEASSVMLERKKSLLSQNRDKSMSQMSGAGDRRGTLNLTQMQSDQMSMNESKKGKKKVSSREEKEAME